MPFIIGLNFRSTSGFVIDGVNETYVLASDSYPTTRGGVTFGWSAGILTGAADRDSGADRRIAGINYKGNSGAQVTFRLDLPASGTHRIRLALGDTGSQAYQYAQLKDGATVITAIDDLSGTAAGHYDDANGSDWSAAAWPASNTVLTYAFSSTTLFVLIGSPDPQSGFSTLAHAALEEVSLATSELHVPPPAFLAM